MSPGNAHQPETGCPPSARGSLAALRRESSTLLILVAAFALGWLGVGLARLAGLWGGPLAEGDGVQLVLAGLILALALAGAVRLPSRLAVAVGALVSPSAILESLGEDERDLNRLFRVLSRTTPDVVAITDEAGRLLRVSENVEEQLGVARETRPDWSLFDVVHPEDRMVVEQLYQVSLHADKPERVVLRVRDRAAATRWVEASLKPIAPAAGAPRMILLVRDITGRMLAEEALRAAEARRRALLAAIPDVILRVRSDGTVLDLSVPEKMQGFTDPTRVRGRRLTTLAPPGIATHIPELITRALTEGGVESGVYHVDVGEERLSRVARIVRSGPDEVLVIIRDVTEHERASRERNRLATVVEQASDGVLVVDGQGAIEYANPAYQKLARLSAEEMVGRSAFELWRDRAPPNLAEGMLADVRAGRTWRGRYRVQEPDGSWRHLTATVYPVRDAEGAIERMVAFVRDITEEMELRENLVRAQRMDSMGRLAGGVAHDFNNLLTVIAGYAELAGRNLDDPVRLERQLAEVLDATHRASEVTRQLLAFSRKQPTQLSAVDLGAVVESLAEMLRRLVGERIRFEIHREPELPATRADPGQVEQVVVNLVLNARDAMPEGGRLRIATRRVELDETRCLEGTRLPPGAYVSLEVGDSGSGMDEETRAQVFEPFYTTKAPGHGSGLGLPAVYGIAQQAGGGVSIETAPGRGTTVTVLLPALGDAPAHEERAERRTAARPAGETVLIVEDDDSVRSFASEVLEAEGYRLLTARDGVEALEIVGASAEPIHLVVTDLVMPRMGGAELVRRLRAEHPEIRVLYTSGYPDSQISAEEAPLAGLLGKPFGTAELATAVRDALDRA